MKSEGKSQKHTILWVFIGILLISAMLVGGVFYKERIMNIEHGNYILGSEANKLQYSLDSRLLKLQILEMMVITDPDIVNQFDEIAEELYAEDPSIRSLQLAPDGLVIYVYPLKGNENAYDDLFADPNRKTEAEYARDTGEMTLAGPFELYQGGTGIVVRRPIYLSDDEENKHFWGFSVAVLDVPEIFDKAELSDLEADGYAYRIWKYDTNGTDKKWIAGSEKELSDKAITKEIQVPGTTWYFTMIRKGGWLSKKEILIITGIALFIDMLLLLVIYYFARSEKQKQRLAVLANTDPLTGLYNSRYLSGVLKKLVEEKQNFVLFFLDMDKFKEINDTYGHDVGDQLLVAAAQRLNGCIRNTDYGFRIGGDEFSLVIVEEENEAACQQITNRIKEKISEPFEIGGIVLQMNTSCGYARYPMDDEDVEKVRILADRHMYEDKEISAKR